MEQTLSLVYPLLAALAAYLIGSLSFAVLVSRVMGLADPRSYGSQNPGATNVLRSGNKAAAALTLLLDGVKGWLPVWAVVRYGAAYGLGDGTLAMVALAAFAVCLPTSRKKSSIEILRVQSALSTKVACVGPFSKSKIRSSCRLMHCTLWCNVSGSRRFRSSLRPDGSPTIPVAPPAKVKGR